MSVKESRTKIYGVWLAMRRRCYLKTCNDYKNYGSRGIVVCDEWKNSYDSFKYWAIHNGYQEGLEIDRNDVDGNYEPSNCRWVTRLVNARNKRNTVHIEMHGETKTLQEWAVEKGFLPSTTRRRYSNGLRGEELFMPLILEPPKCSPRVFIEINGLTKSLKEWAQISGINLKTIENRYHTIGLRDARLIEKPKKGRQLNNENQ